MTNPPPSVASSPDVESAPVVSILPETAGVASFDPGPCGFDLMRKNATALRVAANNGIQVSSSDISNP